MYKGHLYIHGGLDENDKIADQFYSLDLITHSWEHVPLVGETEGLSEHKCAVVGNDQDKEYLTRLFSKNSAIEKLTVKTDSQPDILSEKTSAKRTLSSLSKAQKVLKRTKKDAVIAKEFRVYVFGGRNKNGEGNSSLWSIKPDPNNNWKKSLIETKGVAPRPRIQHSMCALKNTNYISIFGGSNIVAGSYTGNEIMDDFFLFDIYLLHWINVNVSEDKIKRSDSDCCEMDDGNILIFGGVGFRNFVDGVIYKLCVQGEANDTSTTVLPRM